MPVIKFISQYCCLLFITLGFSQSLQAVDELKNLLDMLEPFNRVERSQGSKIAEDLYENKLSKGEYVILSEVESFIRRNHQSPNFVLYGFLNKFDEYITAKQVTSFSFEGGEVVFVHEDYSSFWGKKWLSAIKSKEDNKTSLSVLKSKLGWKDLSPEYLKAISKKIKSVKHIEGFTDLVQRAGIFNSHIVNYSEDDPVMGVIQTAVTLTGYGYNNANAGNDSEAKEAWEIALLLRPRHQSAWIGLAVLAFNARDCEEAVKWADEVLTYKPDIQSDDPIEAAEAEMTIEQVSKEAAIGMNQPYLADIPNAVTEQMRGIKRDCRLIKLGIAK